LKAPVDYQPGLFFCYYLSLSNYSAFFRKVLDCIVIYTTWSVISTTGRNLERWSIE